jgi:hypothetical protein
VHTSNANIKCILEMQTSTEASLRPQMQQHLKTSKAYFMRTSAAASAADFKCILLQPSTAAAALAADFKCILL